MNYKHIAGLLAIGVIVPVAAACGTTRTVTLPAITRTVTVPGPAVTKTVTVRGPTVTVTAPAVTPSTPTPTANSGSNQVITRFNGSGTQNTQSFTTPDNWHLSWSYWGCPNGSSNFIVGEYNADGSLSTGVNVNEIGTGRGPVATYAYGDGGTHYFSVITEGCSWSLVPVTS